MPAGGGSLRGSVCLLQSFLPGWLGSVGLPTQSDFPRCPTLLPLASLHGRLFIPNEHLAPQTPAQHLPLERVSLQPSFCQGCQFQGPDG